MQIPAGRIQLESAEFGQKNQSAGVWRNRLESQLNPPPIPLSQRGPYNPNGFVIFLQPDSILKLN